MSKYLLIASALLLLGSTGLSFLNKSKLAATLDDDRAAHQDATAAHTDANKAHVALTKSLSDTKDANQKAADAQSQLGAVQSQLTDLTAKVDIANKAVADKDAQLADLNKKLGDAMPKVGNDPNAGNIAQQIDDLKKQRDELQVVADGLRDQVKGVQGQLAEAQRREAARVQGTSMNGLRGHVLAVDRNWNFVVLDLGDRNGVNNNATMIVQRGGSLVGRLKITSVEPSQSIADIVPNSVPAGVTVQAGDTVVFPGVGG